MGKTKIKEPFFIGYIISVIYRIIYSLVVIFIVIGETIVRLFTLFFSAVAVLLNYVFRLVFWTYNTIIKQAARLIEKIRRLIVFFKPKKKTFSKINLPASIVKKSITPGRMGFYVKIRYFLAGLFVAIIAVVVIESYFFVYNLPNPRAIGSVNYPVSTKIFDRNDELLYEIYSGQQRTPIELADIPEHVIKATIAIEDKEFYRHNGISLVGGIGRAIRDMLLTKSLQGGSTITQQLVKSALLSPERTISRKIREIFLALWTEKVFTKDEIFQMYINQVPYGGSSYGIEAASQNYFGKSASQLTISEGAFLAGLPQAPTKYSPYTNPMGAKKRRNDVLINMLDLGYITDSQYSKALTDDLIVKPVVRSIKAPHFVFYVRDKLIEKYGIRTVEEGGLRVTTTLDLDLQQKAEQILSEELERIADLNVSNGAVLVTAPSTGDIIAMVGSRNYFQTPYGAYNVTVARRQPGSAIKPLMYSLAFEKGFTAATIIDDAPVIYTSAGAPAYQPVNYDGRYHGKTPVRYALANSYNIPAVKVLNEIGVSNFIAHAGKLGISTWDQPERYGLSLALGGAEVSMTDMAVAYGVFANNGNKVQLDPLLEVVDFRGNIFLSKDRVAAESVISDKIAFIISDILSDNFARQAAFGINSQLEIKGYDTAVKTGTTNEKRDNWTIGYTPRFLSAVWVGNNDNSSMNRDLTSGVTGAAPIFNRIMTYALQSGLHLRTGLLSVPDKFTEPPGIIKKRCYFGKDEYFIAGTEDKASCYSNILDLTIAPGQN